MDTGIARKLALVTASTQGIGLATAKLLAAEGARVRVHGRGGANLAAAVEAVRRAAPAADVAGVAADLATEAGVEALLQAVPAVDILVNGYADPGPKPLAAVSAADWAASLRSNVAVAARLGHHYLDGMLAAGWGRIVFVSSDLALRPLPVMVPYAAGKMAQLTLMRALAELAAGTAVTVNAVLPGFTRTERTEGFLRALAASHGIGFERFMHDYFHERDCPWRDEVGFANSLVRRLLEPEEVAHLIVYLCSTLSAATTGASLRCDGGSTLTAL
ncbi:MAG: SDR family NAD(P)-dependent oxidoreductase [Gammaproteobacteria bacterium]|nr:SDR family NAD(P)-dependent oxidoreductase [Gammaproteobacteria bacterium]